MFKHLKNIIEFCIDNPLTAFGFMLLGVGAVASVYTFIIMLNHGGAFFASLPSFHAFQVTMAASREYVTKLTTPLIMIPTALVYLTAWAWRSLMGAKQSAISSAQPLPRPRATLLPSESPSSGRSSSVAQLQDELRKSVPKRSASSGEATRRRASSTVTPTRSFSESLPAITRDDASLGQHHYQAFQIESSTVQELSNLRRHSAKPGG